MIVTLWHTAEALGVKVRALLEEPKGIRSVRSKCLKGCPAAVDEEH